MPVKRRRKKKRPVAISEIPVVEIISPKINVYGHAPKIRKLEDGTFLGGCSCGWVSRNRVREDRLIQSFWKHAREINNGYLVMGDDEAS